MKSNPWIDAFAIPGTAKGAFSHLERRAVPVTLDCKELESDHQQIMAAMSQVFLCSQQTTQVLRSLLAIGQGHARNFYSDAQGVVGSIYSSHPWGTMTLPAVMLTGLAGIGKSECLAALARLLEERAGKVDLPGHKDVNHTPAWFMSMRDGASLNALLRPYVEGGPNLAVVAAGKAMRGDDLLRLARLISRRDGTCLACVDESQFATHSSGANTRVTQLLLGLFSLGPRLVYTCNFSLGHKLKSRRQEDRQRLLSQPIVLTPDTYDSVCFLDLLTEYFRVAPDDFDLKVKEVAEEVHRYTFGIKRAVVNLLAAAWLIAKSKRGRKAKVGSDDLRAAYLSKLHNNYREDIELLVLHSVGAVKIKQDLINPFGDEPVGEHSKVVIADRAIKEYEQQIRQAHLVDSMTPEQKSALKYLQSQSAPKVSGSDKVVQMKRTTSTKDSRLDALDRL